MATTRLDLAKRITSLVHQRDALAESHAELLAALEWALPYVQDARSAPVGVILTQAVRDEYTRGLYEAKMLIRKARKL